MKTIILDSNSAPLFYTRGPEAAARDEENDARHRAEAEAEYSEADRINTARAMVPTTEEPDINTLMSWMNSPTEAHEATDGCIVEPDGICEHGYPSWLLELGLI